MSAKDFPLSFDTPTSDQWERLDSAYCRDPGHVRAFVSTQLSTDPNAHSLNLAERFGTDVKVLFIVRDRIARSESHWRFALAHRRISNTTAFEPTSDLVINSLYGRYLEQLCLANPKVEVALLDFDAYVEDPTRSLSALCAFAGVHFLGEASAGPAMNVTSGGRFVSGTIRRRVVENDLYRTRLRHMIPQALRNAAKNRPAADDATPPTFPDEVLELFANDQRRLAQLNLPKI